MGRLDLGMGREGDGGGHIEGERRGMHMEHASGVGRQGGNGL